MSKKNKEPEQGKLNLNPKSKVTKSGRPRLERGNFFFSQEEKIKLMELAEQENMSLSMFTRLAVRNALREGTV